MGRKALCIYFLNSSDMTLIENCNYTISGDMIVVESDYTFHPAIYKTKLSNVIIVEPAE